MDFSLNPDQEALVQSTSAIVSDHVELPMDGAVVARVHSYYNDGLDRALSEGGYLDVANTEGLGFLEAALIVLEAGRSPGAIELAASMLIAPLILDASFDRPYAIAREADIHRPIRFLPQAKTLIVLGKQTARAIDLRDRTILPRTATFAYPYGQFADVPAADVGSQLDTSSQRVERLWQVAIAVESAGAMRAAVDLTVEHVKQRVQFGRPIGANQSVQHRLAECAQIVESARWLALRAAWSQSASDAAVAALYVQEYAPRIAFDTHQFNGALGNTLEHPLHFFTYKLRALHSEAGGKAAQSRAVVQSAWEAENQPVENA